MIIINDRIGQLCNRLWAYTPFITVGFKYNIKVWILFFEDYAHLFENLDKYPGIKFNKSRFDFFLQKKIFSLIKIIPSPILSFLKIMVNKGNWTREQWEHKILIDKRNIVFLGGWTHWKNNDHLLEFHDKIMALFTPKKEFVEKVTAVIKDKRKATDLIVGVHIRRGDYSDFAGGQFVFSDSIYSNFMDQIASEAMQLDKKVTFLLCSNEPLDYKSFRNLSFFQIPEAQGIEDLYGLSLCDYIIGVPSTFSMWASFYGRVPLRVVYTPHDIVKINEFSPLVAQDWQANGKRI